MTPAPLRAGVAHLGTIEAVGRLTDTVTERLESRKRKTPLPDWFPKFTIAVGALAALVLGAQSIFGSDGTSPTDNAPRVYVPSPVTASTTTPGPSSTVDEGGSTTAPAPTSPPGTGNTPVRSRDGAAVDVPAPAVDVARRAALAMVSGELDGVPVVGTEPQLTKLPGATTPEVEEVVLLSEGDTSYEFTVTVAPGAGAAGVQRIVTVASVGDGWAWVP